MKEEHKVLINLVKEKCESGELLITFLLGPGCFQLMANGRPVSHLIWIENTLKVANDVAESLSLHGHAGLFPIQLTTYRGIIAVLLGKDSGFNQLLTSDFEIGGDTEEMEKLKSYFFENIIEQ